MKYLFFIYFIIFLCAASIVRKVDETTNLPLDFVQKPISFSTDDPEKVQKQLAFIAQKYSSQAIEWWILYKKALIFKKKDPDLFCRNMHFLSQIQAFPLRDYAHLNLYSDCSEDLKMDLSDFPEWLKKEATKKWYKKANAANNTRELMESSYHLYEFSEDTYLRERYLITAIKMAKAEKDSRLEQWRKQLHILSPRYIQNPSHTQKLAVANDFRSARQFKKAIVYYRQLLNSSRSSFQAKNESFKWIRKIYKMQKNYKKYLIATVQWKNWLKRKIKTDKKAIQAHHNISYLLARSQWTMNQADKALNTLKQIEKEIKGQFSLFNVYRMKALIFDEKNNREKSIFFFKKALKEKQLDIEAYEQTKWNYAWILKKTGQKKESINVLTDLLKTSESDYLPSRALFWIGQTYEDMEEQDKAIKTYTELIKKDPLSYYGLLAHYKLGRKIRIDKNPSFSETESNENYTVVQWLLSLNEYDSALNILKYKSKQYQKDNNKTTKNWATLFYYMAKAHSYFPLFKMVGSLPLKERTLFFRSYSNLIFPLIYVKAVEKAAIMFNVEKELMYALIRQESAWNPKARSPADAFGLMQIRPFVAKKIAKKNGISYNNMYELYNPEKNILLGTAFLKQLFDKYNSQFVITLAVYNAGGTAVRNWMKKLPLDKPLSFIEEIPYQETRTYVRLLIRNFVFYKLLTSPDKELFFPEWILHINKKENK